jgi:glutamate-5-semialdehyde dehydrogenase
VSEEEAPRQAIPLPARDSAFIEEVVAEQAQRARAAARRLSSTSRATKDAVLARVAKLLRRQADEAETPIDPNRPRATPPPPSMQTPYYPAPVPILVANARDMAAAEARGVTPAFLDRLKLTPARLRGMADAVDAVQALPDPVGEVIRGWRRPNGLDIAMRRVPLGVVGIIYEARPNVTVEVTALCLKSGNACVLKGGSDGIETNRALVALIKSSGEAQGLPTSFVEFIDSTDRRAVTAMLAQQDVIDVIIPRGGESLIRAVVNESRIPVIRQYKGVCHTYVDESADLEMAHRIAVNAKCSRPAVCNAMETLLIHESVAPQFLPALAADLAARRVELRGCPRSRELVHEMKEATDHDWAEEYLDLILAVRVVSSLDEAMEHIAKYGTMHSEAIVTRDQDRARRFQEEVDAAAVYVNASTRFTDGFEFGFGAEVGISTGKLHSRGPMVLEDLTTRKFVISGTGQIRE